MRLFHTMLRVGDLQRFIDLYTRILGHESAASKREYRIQIQHARLRRLRPGKREQCARTDLQLGTDKYDLGTAYGHIALEVDDAADACERIRQASGKVTREAGPVKGSTTVIAFVEDPDGYKVELIEKHS